MTVRSFLRSAAVGLLVLYAAASAYTVAAPVVGWPRPLWLLHLATVAFFGFALLHAGLHLGPGHAAAFLAIAFGVSLAFESVGVLTGAIYGPYHYGDQLGWKIFGLVPVLIPLAWFMMLYPSHVLVELLGGRRRGGVLRAVWLAFLAAVAVTAWDLLMDPGMSSWGAWVWHEPGPYFGVPLRNFLGWLETTFTVFLLYRLLALRWPPRTAEGSGFARLPVAGYAVTWLVHVGDSALNGDPVLALIGFFAMGAFVLVAATRLLDEGQAALPAADPRPGSG